MPAPFSREADRRTQFIRQWRLLVLLRRGPKTLEYLAHELRCHQRTVRRDLYALQAVPLPIASKYPANEGIDPFPLKDRQRDDRNVWALGVMDEWPRTDETPTDELEAR